jgi:hypothetical protein
MFVPANAIPSAFVVLGCHSFFGGRDSFSLVQRTFTAKSGRAFLSISRYWASASSRLRSCYTLRI